MDISQFYCDQLSRHSSRNRPSTSSIEEIDSPVEISTGLIHHLILFRRLKTLNLSHAYITSQALEELSTFLENNDTLLELDISSNNILAEGTLNVLKSLDKSTTSTVEKLNLNDNNICGKRKEITTIIHRLRYRINVDINF